MWMLKILHKIQIPSNSEFFIFFFLQISWFSVELHKKDYAIRQSLITKWTGNGIKFYLLIRTQLKCFCKTTVQKDFIKKKN